MTLRASAAGAWAKIGQACSCGACLCRMRSRDLRSVLGPTPEQSCNSMPTLSNVYRMHVLLPMHWQVHLEGSSSTAAVAGSTSSRTRRGRSRRSLGAWSMKQTDRSTCNRRRESCVAAQQCVPRQSVASYRGCGEGRGICRESLWSGVRADVGCIGSQRHYPARGSSHMF